MYINSTVVDVFLIILYGLNLSDNLIRDLSGIYY